jgi:uncharacterized protein
VPRDVAFTPVPVPRRRRALLAVAALLAVPGCGQAAPEAPDGPDDRPTVSATLGGVALELEEARTEQERATGLMGRQEVPPGTGMIFYFDEPVQARFYMYDVPVPLTAVFVREGEVLAAIDMPPCEEDAPERCPTYGPDEPFDTVVETAPETVEDVRPGDRLEVAG